MPLGETRTDETACRPMAEAEGRVLRGAVPAGCSGMPWWWNTVMWTHRGLDTLALSTVKPSVKSTLLTQKTLKECS